MLAVEIRLALVVKNPAPGTRMMLLVFVALPISPQVIFVWEIKIFELNGFTALKIVLLFALLQLRPIPNQ